MHIFKVSVYLLKRYYIWLVKDFSIELSKTALLRNTQEASYSEVVLGQATDFTTLTPQLLSGVSV